MHAMRKASIARARITGYLGQAHENSPSLSPVFSQMYAYFRVHLEDGLLTLKGILSVRKSSPPARAVL